MEISFEVITFEPVLSGHSKMEKTKVLKTDGCLMQVKSIAECSPWSILQYFSPALSYNWSFLGMAVLDGFYCIDDGGHISHEGPPMITISHQEPTAQES